MNTPLPHSLPDIPLGKDVPLFGIGQVLDLALRENRVLAAYQPIIDLKTGAIVAEEALARIVSPNRSIIPASVFLGVAQELALTPLLDRTIMLQTFARCAAAPLQDPPRAYFLNISTSLLRETNMMAELLHAANRNGAPDTENTAAGKPFVIQLTSRELRDHPQETQRSLAPFLDFGMRLALDDFGSGGSSYKYLASLPFSFLKIEGDLIRRIAEARVRTIVQGIQQIAAGLGIVTLAEHIESEEIADQVRGVGIDWGQGKYFGKPVIPSLIRSADKI